VTATRKPKVQTYPDSWAEDLLRRAEERNKLEAEYNERLAKGRRKMMKIFGALGVGVLGAILFFSFYTPRWVEPGHVGVIVNAYGDEKGVSLEEAKVGRHWLTWNESLYVFPTFTQNYTWVAESRDGDESFRFNDVDGTSLNADVGISYSIDPDKVPMIFQKYRRGIEEITDTYLRNHVRDAITSEASVLTVDAIYGKDKEKLLDRVTERVKAKVEPIGIKIEELYWIGEIRIPKEIKDALNLKIAANQQADQSRNEVLKRKYEADKKIEDARGVAESILVNAKKQAEANDLLTKSLTPELLQYKKLENEIKAIEKWGGVLPSFIGGSTPVPFIDVTTQAITPTK
jgi:regulator of protease activity HflC (stomatin/prohibitin superfamily)